MIGIKALKDSQQVPVVVLLIIALLLYALLGMRTTAQNILDRPPRSFVRVPSGFGSSVQEGAVRIRDAVRSQVNRLSAIGPALPGVNANPEANLRVVQAAVQAPELTPPVPAAPAVAPAVTPEAAKPEKGASASKTASENAAPGRSNTAPSRSGFSDTGKQNKAAGKKDKQDGKHLVILANGSDKAKGPGKKS